MEIRWRFIFLYQKKLNVKLVAVKKDPATPGVAPSEQTAVDGSYPISRQLYFYYSSNAPARVQELANWAVSEAGQSVVQNVGYFPLPKAGGASSASEVATPTPAAQ